MDPTDTIPFDAMHKAMTQNPTNLKGVIIQHGTSEANMIKIIKEGLKDIGKGLGGLGTYFALKNEVSVATEYAGISGQNFKDGEKAAVMTGKINSDRNFRIGRITLANRYSPGNLAKGIFPANWMKDSRLQDYMCKNFDILEVCGAKAAGYAIESNRFLVVHESAGRDAIIWKKNAKIFNPHAANPAGTMTRINLSSISQTEASPLQSKPPSISLSELNQLSKPTTLQKLLKSLGNGVQKLQKIKKFGGPVIGAPLEFFFHYTPEDENRILKSLINGCVNWHLASANFKLYASIPIVGLPIAIAQKAADIAPNCSEMADHLLLQFSSQKIDDLSPPGSLINITVQSQVVNTAAKLYILGSIQKLLQKLPNLVHLWNDYVRKKIDNTIDHALASPSTKEEEIHQQLSSNDNANLDYLEELFQNDLLENWQNPKSFSSDSLVSDAASFPGSLPPFNYAINNAAESCSLPWQYSFDLEKGFTKAITTIEISHNEWNEWFIHTSEQDDEPDNFNEPLDASNESLQLPAAPLSSFLHALDAPSLESVGLSHEPPIHYPTDRDDETPPTFGELAKIKSLSLDTTPAGGPRINAILESGAKVGLALTGNGAAVYLSFPLGPGAMTALGTGLCYAAPIAAVLLVTSLVMKRHYKKISNHLKHDSKKANEELSSVNNHLERFNGFYQDLASGSGTISEEEFVEQANKISGELQKAASHMGKYGKYADDYKKQSGHSAWRYFTQKVLLQQIDLDLKLLTQEVTTQNKVEQQYRPQLPQKSLESLVYELKSLHDKKLLTTEEKFQQEVLSQEVSDRIGKGLTAEELTKLSMLADHPSAINCNPQGIAKPSHISRKHFYTGEDRARSRSKNVEAWANKLKKLYDDFCNASRSCDLGAMEKAGNDIFDHIAKTDRKEHHVNLAEYKLTGLRDGSGNKYETAADYYKSYIEKIKNSISDTLMKASNASQGIITKETTPLFTTAELQDIKISFAFNRFDSASQKLGSEGTTPQEKDEAFATMVGATLELENLGYKAEGELAQIFESTLEISKQYDCYSAYQKAIDTEHKISAALDQFNSANQKLHSEGTTPQEKDEAFATMVGTIQELVDLGYKAEGEGKLLLENTLEIYKKFDCYSAFIRSLDIKEKIKQLLSFVNKLNDEASEEYGENFALAVKVAEELLTTMSLSQEDLLKFIENEDQEEAKNLFELISSLPAAYRDHSTFIFYNNDTLHRFASPAVNILFHIANNLERYEGYNELKSAGKFLSVCHSVAPMVLPSTANYMIALLRKENSAVKKALYAACSKAMKNNLLAKSFALAQDPLGIFNKASSLNKKAGLVLAVNATVQGTCKLIDVSARKIFGKENHRVEQLTCMLNRAAAVANNVNTAFYYANLFNKTFKYARLGNLGLKVHKIGQGLVSLGMMGTFDLFEFMASELSESSDQKDLWNLWGISDNFKTKAKQYIPNYNGNLPENMSYYVGKDAITLTAFYALSNNPIMAGCALWQGVNTLYNAYEGKYTDDVLVAIMMNYRYFQSQTPCRAIDEAMAKSIDNLKYYLESNYVIAKGDSKIRQAAKSLHFETHLDSLKKDKNWGKIMEETFIIFGQEKAFLLQNEYLDLFTNANVIIKRFSALQEQISKDPIFGLNAIPPNIKELNSIISYFEMKFACMTEPEKRNSKEFKESILKIFKAIKINLLTDFSILYVQERRQCSPLIALELFAKHLTGDYGVSLWDMLGCIAFEFKEIASSKETKRKMLALHLFCLEKMNEIVKKIENPSEIVISYQELLKDRCEQFQSKLTNSEKLFWQKIDFTTLPQEIDKLLSPTDQTPIALPKTPRKLINIGNSSSINAVLQFVLPLFYASFKPIKEVLIQKNEDSTIRLIDSLRNIAQGPAVSAYQLMKLQKALIENLRLYPCGKQPDAQVILSYLLAVFVKNLEGSQLQYINKTAPYNSTQSRNLSRSPMIYLNFQDEKEVTLIELFKQEQQRNQQLQILLNTPKILFLDINRQHSWYDSKNGIGKNKAPLILPEEGRIDLAPFFNKSEKIEYQIIGRINHVGDNLNSGHYTADILRGEGEPLWFHCDDDKIAEGLHFSWNDRTDSSAYLLALKRIDEAKS